MSVAASEMSRQQSKTDRRLKHIAMAMVASLPHNLTRFKDELLSSGQWLIEEQDAFLDERSPGNCYPDGLFFRHERFTRQERGIDVPLIRITPTPTSKQGTMEYDIKPGTESSPIQPTTSTNSAQDRLRDPRHITKAQRKVNRQAQREQIAKGWVTQNEPVRTIQMDGPTRKYEIAIDE